MRFGKPFYPDRNAIACSISQFAWEQFTMNRITPRLPVSVVCLALLLYGIEGSVAHPVSSAESSKPAACAAAEYRQFDFFVGDWDAYDVENPGTIVARNQVTRILDNCVVLEDYRGTNGSHGESFSIYDASRDVWHQTWVTNRGKLLIIEG